MKMEDSVDCPEITLKELCCTCLSGDRKLFQLCRMNEGVNNLYSLLSYDSEAYREGFYKDAGSLFICWECGAIMRKIMVFRKQACVALKRLSTITDGRNDVKSLKTCLSHLSRYHKRSYDATFIANMDSSNASDNFIDCGFDVDIKKETDVDDIPLSELHDNYISDNDNTSNGLDTYEAPSVYKKKKRVKIKKRSSVKDLEVDVDKKLNFSEVECGDAEFKCESCAQVFKEQSDLDTHNSEVHKKTKRKSPRVIKPGSKPRRNAAMMDKRTPYGYPCAECNKYFDNKNQRWKHVQRHHREGFKCDTCGKRFAFKNNLSRHQQLHQAPPPREECTVCHKMIRVDLVKIHARIHTAREQFSCAGCQKRFVSRASYEHHLKYTQAHARATVDILKYKCSVCDKGYRSRGELRDHVNYQHMGKTQHKCPVCGKALATRRCITRHVRRAHQGIKENSRDKICQQCGKAFRDKKGLREHEFIHTGERPLSCEICGCTFRQTASLYTHRKRIHKIYPKKKNVELLES